jgi:hypothetical protein
LGAEVIVVTEHRSEALARLDAFVGEWVIEARFPGDQPTPANTKIVERESFLLGL